MTRPASQPERIEIPDGIARPARLRACSGALLMVTLAEYRELERHGLRWVTRSDELPKDGVRGPGRTACSADEVILMRDGRSYGYGLCAECTRLEAEHRRVMRRRVAE